MDKDEMINETINNIIKETKCFNCIHAPICFAQKGGVDLQLASEMGCQYYQTKIAEDEIVVKKRQYEQLKKYNRDRKRLRLKWQQAKQDLDDIYSNGFVLLVEHHEIVDQVARETRQETAREILQIIKDEYEYIEHISDLERIIAKAYGIELED